MKTASHFTYTGPGRVVISLGNPRGVPGGYRRYAPLMPKRDMLRLDHDDYHPRFVADILDPLDPAQVWRELHALHGEGIEPVLQCFERPPLDRRNFCHRRMVAAWFEQRLGVSVPEFEP